MSERTKRERERGSRHERERTQERRRARRQSRRATTQQTLDTGVQQPQQFQQLPQNTGQQLQQSPGFQQPSQQQLQQQPGQQFQQPSSQQGIPQQPQQGLAPQPSVGEHQPTSQQSGQQPQQPGQQPQQQGIGSYGPQAPFAVGLPAGGAQAFGPQQQFGTANQQFSTVPNQPTTPTAGAYAGSMQGQLASQPAGIYPEAFADHLTSAARDCLDDCIDVSQVAAWCSDRCLEHGPGMAECSRLCNEVATIGAVAAEFIARDSMNLPVIVEAYVDTAERAVDELAKFDTPHTNETEMVLERSIESSLDLLDTR